jgi:hypothetical protein
VTGASATNAPTNVARLSGAVRYKCCTGMPQVVFYHRGAGTDAFWIAQQLGGILGLGVTQVSLRYLAFSPHVRLSTATTLQAAGY